MKLVDSPLCKICKTTQNSEHIFYLCSNAKNANNALLNFREVLNDPYFRNNVDSLIKRLLFLKKDKATNPALFEIAIKNRIDDLEKILKQKAYNKKLKVMTRH